MNPFVMAVNTAKASRWEMLKARWLGTKVKGFDDDCTWTGYYWRGKYYMTDFELQFDIGERGE